MKGKPGTGKSTVALYRIKFLLDQLSHAEPSELRILFTTYTNALVESSKSLLEQLLGTAMTSVEVRTADDLIFSLLGEKRSPADDGTLSWLLKEAVEQALPEEEMRRRFLSRVSYDYLKEEICQLILARQVSSIQQHGALYRA